MKPLTQDKHDQLHAAAISALLSEGVPIESYELVGLHARNPYFGAGKPGDMIFVARFKNRFSKQHKNWLFSGYYEAGRDQVREGKLVIRI